jgi:spermidine/putrescine transport system permease protein
MEHKKSRFDSPRSYVKGTPIILWLLFLVIVPLIFTFAMSFYSSEGLVLEKTFTLKNYKVFFTDPVYSRILFKSLRLALSVSLLSIAMAYPLAYMVSFKMVRSRNLLFMMCIYTDGHWDHQ